MSNNKVDATFHPDDEAKAKIAEARGKRQEPTEPTPVQRMAPNRCSFRWTPEPFNGICYSEVQCTWRDDVPHQHTWNSYEHDLWVRAGFGERDTPVPHAHMDEH